MGLFPNTTSSEFKRIFIDSLARITGFSFGTIRLSDKIALIKINIQFKELIEIARRYNNPYNEYFNIYSISVLGRNISIAEGLLIINRCIELLSKRERITQEIADRLIEYARSEVGTSFGQSKVKEILNS